MLHAVELGPQNTPQTTRDNLGMGIQTFSCSVNVLSGPKKPMANNTRSHSHNFSVPGTSFMA